MLLKETGRQMMSGFFLVTSVLQCYSDTVLHVLHVLQCDSATCATVIQCATVLQCYSVKVCYSGRLRKCGTER